MPLPDNVWDRLKGALVSGDTTADDGRPAMVVADPSGFTVAGFSAANAAQTLTQNPVAAERSKITGFEVALSGLGAAPETTISVLGSGAAVLWQTLTPSGGTDRVVERDFRFPIDAGLGATVQLYVGPGGASIRSLANFRGYSVGG